MYQLFPSTLAVPAKIPIYRPTLLRCFAFIALTLTTCALSPAARGVSPPPDGGYPGANTAEGVDPLFSITTGEANTAVGYSALYSDKKGSLNTALGLQTLNFNITGNDNTATGGNALLRNKSGNGNTASGVAALDHNTTGDSNTAIGTNALESNTTGDGNIALGYAAGYNLTTGSNNIDIGALGTAGEANTIRVGKKGTHKATFIQGISGAAVGNGVQVVVNPGGKLGAAVSSARFKRAIKPMDDASEALLALRPVTFQYQQDLDPDGIPQFGLVAEEVEQVNPDLVARDADGKAYTVRYEAVNAMLLNEFLKEHRKVEEQEAVIGELKSAAARQQSIATTQQKEIEALTCAMKQQASEIKKVSASVALQRTAAQVAASSR